MPMKAKIAEDMTVYLNYKDLLRRRDFWSVVMKRTD